MKRWNENIIFLIVLFMLAYGVFGNSSKAGDVDYTYRSSVAKEGVAVGPEWKVIKKHVFDNSGYYLVLYRVNPINNMRYNVAFTVEIRVNNKRVAIVGENISRDQHYGDYFLYHTQEFQSGDEVLVRVKSDSTNGMKPKSVIIPYENYGKQDLTIIRLGEHS